MAKAKIGGLGRGLEELGLGLNAIFPEPVSVENTKETLKENEKSEPEKAPASDNSIKFIAIHDIRPNPDQPRKVFNKEKISELAKSITEHGIIQPIVVRKINEGFEIVAGERRWRAAIAAGLKEAPCIVRELTDEQNMLFAIIENMQREDLNPIEEAEGLEKMIRAFGMTQEQVSKGVGKSRPYITNSLRLLKLPEYIRECISDGRISAAHGRTLVTVSDEKKRKQIIDRIIADELSVRETEKLVNELSKTARKKERTRKDPDLERVESDLKQSLGTRVNINRKGKKGKIEIEFFSADELERLIELLKSLGQE